MKEYHGSSADGASLYIHSRRKFLTQAAASAFAVGASAFTLPFLEESAHAQTCGSGGGGSNYYTPPGSPTDNPPSCSNVDNIPSPDPWLIRGCCTDTVCGYNAAGITVTGVRHYCGQDIIPWGTTATNPNGTPFPERPDGASFCLTIYPIVDKLLKRNAYAGTSGYDNDLTPFFQSFLPRDMMSCWHEVANVTPKQDKDCHTITAADEVAMQQYLLNFRNSLGLKNPVAFGAIECPSETNGSTDYGIARCKPFMMKGLDFYGQDLYRMNYSDPAQPLTAWDNEFGSGSTYTPTGAPSLATIAVCECNCQTSSYRAKYFNDAAYWLWNQKNRGARSFLTFWNYTQGPDESGPWLPDDSATITALKNIGNGNYSNP